MTDIYGKKHEIELYCIAQEQHKDGNFHLHAYFRFKKTIRSTDCQLFDFNYDGTMYHPNIKTIRTHKKWVAYCCKHDETPLMNFDASQSYRKVMKEYMHYGAEEFKEETPQMVCTIAKAI